MGYGIFTPVSLWDCHMIKQEPSVDLALKIIDGTPLRPGHSLIMSVTRAKFEQKGTDS